MKYLNSKNYVEVKDKGYVIHAKEIKIIRKRDSPLSLRTQYQVQHKTQMRKNQKVVGYQGKIQVEN